MPGSWPANDFPHLTPQDHAITSEETTEYNCIAWAACDSNQWWEPDSDNTYYWPPLATRDYTIQAFIEAFQAQEYAVCLTPDIEEGFEKIAIYANEYDEPTHIARQLPEGKWTSKLGPFEDIEHNNLECLNGDLYGSPHTYMRRQTQPPVC